jgi:hypothetical protein
MSRQFEKYSGVLDDLMHGEEVELDKAIIAM